MFESLFSESGLSLDRFRSFLAVVEARGIMAASHGDAARQSQLSRQLADLETFFGSKLVMRGKRSQFSLTEAGELLRTTLVQAFGSLESLKDRLKSRDITLRVGAGESILAWHVLPRLDVLKKEHPNTTVLCLNLRSDEIARRLAEGSLDLGVIRRSIKAAGLKSASIGYYGYSLVVPWSLSSRGSKPKLLTELPLAVLDDSTSLRDLEQAAGGKPLTIVCRCTSYAQVRAAVLSGECAALVPDFMVSDLNAGACSIRSIPRLRMELNAVWNPSALRFNPALSDLVNWAAKSWFTQSK
jgi:DNA-binding transcriptional LysR family regulator